MFLKRHQFGFPGFLARHSAAALPSADREVSPEVLAQGLANTFLLVAAFNLAVLRSTGKLVRGVMLSSKTGRGLCMQPLHGIKRATTASWGSEVSHPTAG